MLSKKAKYGIHALIHLAQSKGSGPLLIRDIANDLDIPKKFLETILLDLRNEGILRSRQGREGGYYLERAPDTITLGRVIRLIDGPLAEVPCVSQTAYARCDDCLDEQRCAIRWIMRDVRDSTAKILDHTTLERLVEKARELAHPVGAEYEI